MVFIASQFDQNCLSFSLGLTSTYSGFIDSKNIEDYVSNREKYIDRGKGIDFRNAIGKIDDFVSDPEVNFENARC